MTSFCKWNPKYRVCYTEEQNTFAEIIVSTDADIETIVTVLEEKYNVVVVVGEDNGRPVIIVYGDDKMVEAVRQIPATGCDGKGCEGVIGVDTFDAAAAVEESTVEEGIKKSTFTAGVAVGGVAILGLIAAIAAQLIQNSRTPKPIAI